jgi:hypothetical protein
VSFVEDGARAAAILKTGGVREGYAVVFGIGKDSLASDLVRQSNLRVIVIESDAAKANNFRNGLRFSGIGSDRVTVLVADPAQIELPPYLASLYSIPLLTREGEVNLARRMERGKLRMQKAVSRSALVQLMAVEIVLSSVSRQPQP